MVKNQFEQVSPAVWSHSTSATSSRVSYIELKHFLVAVDSGWHTNVTKKAREFIEHKTAKKVKYLILTHAHGDHIFGTKYFSDCEIVASHGTFLLVHKRIEERENYKDKGIIIPKTTLEYTLMKQDFSILKLRMMKTLSML